MVRLILLSSKNDQNCVLKFMLLFARRSAAVSIMLDSESYVF